MISRPQERQTALALHAQGVAALRAGDCVQAAVLLRAAVDADGTIAALHANLGVALHGLGQAAAAEAAYRRALALDARLAAAHNSLGTALQDQGRPAEAEAAFRAALALAPDYHEAGVNLGGTLHARKCWSEAEAILRAAVARAPDDPLARVNLAAVLKESGRVDEAETHLVEALRLQPGEPQALVNLALTRERRERWDEAEALYRQAQAAAPGAPLPSWNLGLLLLRQGRLGEGWPLYAARFAAEPDSRFAPPPLPPWRGEPLNGRTLLAWREQGLGDSLMFGALLPQLLTTLGNGGRLIVAVEPRLVALFARALPAASVVAAPVGPPLSGFGADLHCPLGSLPELLRPRLSDWRAAAPVWLAAEPQRLAAWRERLAALGPGLKIGVAWRSAVATGERAAAYLSLCDLAPLAAVPGVRLINLQYDLTAQEAAAAATELGAPLACWPDADLRDDLETAAALAAACDLVISVASSVGEMAAAAGAPTWRLGGRDWTMFGTGARPWFPAMRVWSPRPGETLADVAPRMADELRRLAVSAVDPPTVDPFDEALAAAARLHDAGRGAQAEKAYQAALALRPGDGRAAAGYARLAREAGRPDLAAALLGGGVHDGAAAAERAAALGAWADLLAAAGEAERAAKAWWALILADPGGGDGFAGLANLRAGQGRHPQALRGWERAIKADPACGEWRYNQGNSLKALGRPAEADAAYAAAARCNPSLALAEFNRGYAALEQGRLADGWDGLEKRFAAGRAKPDRRFDCPPWRGAALNGGDLLIWREQGIGDELMFAACYAAAIARARAAGAGRVLIDAEPRLTGLLARTLASFDNVTVRPWRDGDPSPAGLAAHVPAGSLPALLRRRLADFVGGPAPFLVPDPRPAAVWRDRLAALGPELKVGICWRSGLRAADRLAAATSLDDWGPLLTAAGVRCVNLQYDDCAAELAAAERRFGVAVHRPPGLDLRQDLEGVAALIAALDLVVSAGTSVAELAGALGTPTWRLCRPGEWSALGASCRPWFPSVRLLQPPPGGDMADALAKAARELARLRPAASPQPPPPAPTGKPADLLARGVELHRAGKLDAAAAHYRAVSKGKPPYADARHLLGMIACAQGRFDAALADFDAAVAANARAPDFHANRAFALHALGRFADAAAAAGRALKLKQNHAEAANTLGNALAAQGEWETAVSAYRTALQARSDYAEAAANLGAALAAAGRPEAAAVLRPALAAAPTHGPARSAWADRLLRDGDGAAAARQYRILLALQPANPTGWLGLGRAESRLDVLNGVTTASACWRRAVRIAPTLAEPWSLLGAAHQKIDDAAAARFFAAALAVEPGRAGGLSNLAMARRGQGDGAAAARLFVRALAVDPGDGLARFNRGVMRLTDGDSGGVVAGAWADYDGRLSAPALFPPPALPCPFWRGEPLRDRHVLVWREQGLGDELLFAALYPRLLRHAGRATLACDPRLVGLLARAFPGATVRPLADCVRDPDSSVDFQVAAGSLARYLAPNIADFAPPPPAPPPAPGWLRPDPVRAAAWRARLDGLGPGLKLGVAWTSRRLDAARVAAYLPLAALAPALSLPGVVPVSLQYDGRHEEIAELSATCGLRVAAFPDVDLKNDLETAAALTAACDLVLSVASSVAETAAALGVPVWRLGRRDWTWLGTGARPWGPSMRLWPPRGGEDLTAVVARAALELRRLTGVAGS